MGCTSSLHEATAPPTEQETSLPNLDMDPPPEYYEVTSEHQRRSMENLDREMRSTVFEIEDSKQELLKVKAFNINLEKKIESADEERKSLEVKLDSLKAKLAVSNANMTRYNDEKETLRTKLNDSQVLVARLEERVSAATSELDRMRDPGNPESNMNIRKQVLNNKKEIKHLKEELSTENNNLEADKGIAEEREEEIKRLEKEQKSVEKQLNQSHEDRVQTLKDEIEERAKKEELIQNYKDLKEERKTFESRLKEAKILLGVKTSGKNVGDKLYVEMKDHEKLLQKKLNSIEKRLKDSVNDLDVFKNQHKMSKTALSINKFTVRTSKEKDRASVGSTDSLAMPGLGPLRFAPKGAKGDKPVGSQTDRPKTLNKAENGGKIAGSLSDRTLKLSDVKTKSTSLPDRASKAPFKGSHDNLVKARRESVSDRSTNSLTKQPPKQASTPVIARKGSVSDKPAVGGYGSQAHITQQAPQVASSRRDSVAPIKTDRKNSTQFVPPPKPKLKGK